MDTRIKKAIIGAAGVIIAAVILAVIGPIIMKGCRETAIERDGIPRSELEQELSKANINLSELGPDKVGEVREWLLRSDPAYQFLAGSCLKILARKRLIGIVPIPLEVIMDKYRMELTGSMGYVPVERMKALDEDLSKLKIAIFKTWKERNTGYSQTSFDEVISSI